MTICIYCKKNQTAHNFSNREHVIPQSFGKFEPNNFILNKRDNRTKHVCNNCNKKFGSLIDRCLAKDSYEGYVLRTKYLKNVESTSRLRVSIKIKEGELKGLNMYLTGKDTAEVSPQIGLLNKKDEWEYFLPNEISKIHKNNYKLSGKSVVAFQMSDTEIKEIFLKIGINFLPGEPFPKPTVTDLLCKVDSNIDLIIKQAVAKIAFNYFSYFNYKRIVLTKNFDAIRKFILTGEGDHPIMINNDPILADEGRTSRRLGHLIVINVNQFGNIVAQVSLFNELKYTIFLGAANSLHKLNVGFGHIFDPNSKRILQIEKSHLIIPKINLIVPKKKIWLPRN